MGFAKNRLTHIQNPPGLASGEPHGGDGKKTTKSEPQPTPGAALQFATSILFLFSFPRPRSFFFSFLPSPRIPTDRRAGRGTPPRADSRAVGFRETHPAPVSLKIDSRPRKTAPGAGCRREANVAPRSRSREDDALPPQSPRTACLPGTYPAPTLHPAPAGGVDRLPGPHPRALPRRHRALTLHLPCTYPVPTLHLPCTEPWASGVPAPAGGPATGRRTDGRARRGRTKTNFSFPFFFPSPFSFLSNSMYK